MKNKKIYISVIVLTFIATFIIMKTFDSKSYAASNTEVGVSISDGTEFSFSYKNMYAHYHITNNFNRSASGTKVITSKDGNNTPVVVYCAEQGKTLGTGYVRTRYSLASSNVSWSQDIKDKLSKMMMYAYPYITLGELKTTLKDATIGLGSDYDTYKFDDLNAQETVLAVQASIWNIAKNTTKFKFDRSLGKLSPSQDSSLSRFKTCESYHDGKILTTEEEEWYNTSGCDTNGNFYKYVYSLNDTTSAANRVNALIDWYTTTLLSKVTTSSTDNDSYKIASSQFNADNSLDVTISTNVANYSIVFKDVNGNTLLSTTNASGNTFHVTNLPTDTKEVKAIVTSQNSKKNVYYYKGEGQDLIGVDITKYTDTLSIVNNGTGKIIIYKVTGSDKNVEVNYGLSDVDESLCGTNGCLNDATFKLYYSNKNNLRQYITTNYTKSSSGAFQGVVISNLPVGTYYLIEEESPVGYDKYDYNTSTVDSEGYIKIDISENSVASVIVNNDKTKICFSKVDKTDKTKILDGAEFWIEDIDESLYVDFVSSSQEGSYCLEGIIQTGTYYLNEVVAPNNYLKVNTKYKFTVGKHITPSTTNDNAQVIKAVHDTIVIENTPGVYVTKSDMSTGSCLEGATLTVKDENGNKIDEWVSSCMKDHSGQIIESNPHELTLEPGKYTLTETVTPSGYATAETISFTINEDGRVDKKLDMKDDPIEICLQKISEDKKELDGAEFELYDEKGSLVQKLTTPDNDCVKYLPIGKYTVKETKAPAGYKLNEEITTIEVKDTNQTQIFEIVNEVDVPKTSLDASKVITMIASVFIIFGIGAVSYYVYQKQN